MCQQHISSQVAFNFCLILKILHPLYVCSMHYNLWLSPLTVQKNHLQVSGRLLELKTTIDAGLHHRDHLLNTIGAQFEQWDVLVCQK